MRELVELGELDGALGAAGGKRAKKRWSRGCRVFASLMCWMVVGILMWEYERRYVGRDSMTARRLLYFEVRISVRATQMQTFQMDAIWSSKSGVLPRCFNETRPCLPFNTAFVTYGRLANLLLVSVPMYVRVRVHN